mgnify:CR=1 FL=1
MDRAPMTFETWNMSQRDIDAWSQLDPSWDCQNPGQFPSPGWYRVTLIGNDPVSFDGPYSSKRIAEGR